MFESEKLPHHVQSVKFSGDEETPSLIVAFYMTPVSHAIVYELSDRIAKQIFRREGKNEIPVAELGKTILNLGSIPAVNLEVFPHNQEGSDGSGQLIPGCKIGEVAVDKLFADSSDWSLIWKCTMPLDSNSLDLMRRYYRKTCFLTLVAVQDELFDAGADGKPKPIVLSDAEVECPVRMICQVCNETATYLGEDTSAWCDKDVRAAVGVKVRQIRYAESAK